MVYVTSFSSFYAVEPVLYKLFHSVIDQIIKSLNNGTLYFPFVISLYALCNSVTYNKYKSNEVFLNSVTNGNKRRNLMGNKILYYRSPPSVTCMARDFKTWLF